MRRLGIYRHNIVWNQGSNKKNNIQQKYRGRFNIESSRLIPTFCVHLISFRWIRSIRNVEFRAKHGKYTGNEMVHWYIRGSLSPISSINPNRDCGLWYPNPAASRLITISASAVIRSRPRPRRSLNHPHPHPSPFPPPSLLLLLFSSFSPVYTSIVISATLRLTLSPFILRSLERFPPNNSPLFAPPRRYQQDDFYHCRGFSSSLSLSNESPDIEFLRAGACTIMNKASSSRRRLRQRWRVEWRVHFCVARSFRKIFSKELPLVLYTRELARVHSRERYCPRRFPLILRSSYYKDGNTL